MSAKKSAEVTVIPVTSNQQVAPVESNVFSAIERIMTDPNASVERANQAFEFYQKVEADKARKAFNNAMADAKAKIPPIVKGQSVKFEHNGKTTEYDHENLADIAAIVDPILADHGLSYRYRTTSNPNEPIRCTCILSHRLGHQEENTLSAASDTSGGKNSIQGIGSTLQYLMRYSLKASLGLSVKKKDDDGKGADATDDSSEPVTQEQLDELLTLAEKVGADKERFCKFYKVESFADITRGKFNDAKAALNKKRG